MFVLLCLCCITQFNRFLGLGLRVLSLCFFVLHFGSTFCVFQSSGHIVCYIVSLGLIILIIILIIMIIPVSCNVIFSDCLVHRFINSFLYSYSVLPVMFLFLVCLCVRLVLALVSVIMISCFIVIVSHPVCIMSSFPSIEEVSVKEELAHSNRAFPGKKQEKQCSAEPAAPAKTISL